MASITQFRQNLAGGGARPNQFRVSLFFPAFVPNAAAAGRKTEFLCTATHLPGSHIGIASAWYRGREVKLAGERTFQNWTVNVINDTDFAIHDALEQWASFINDPQFNTGLTNPTSYTAALTVEQLDRDGATIKQYTLIDAWPTNLSEIQLAFQANDQLEEFNVEFAYSYWETTYDLAPSAGLPGL